MIDLSRPRRGKGGGSVEYLRGGAECKSASNANAAGRSRRTTRRSWWPGFSSTPSRSTTWRASPKTRCLPRPGQLKHESGGEKHEILVLALRRRVEDARPGEPPDAAATGRVREVLRRIVRQGYVQGRRPGPAVEDGNHRARAQRIDEDRVRPGHHGQ